MSGRRQGLVALALIALAHAGCVEQQRVVRDPLSMTTRVSLTSSTERSAATRPFEETLAPFSDLDRFGVPDPNHPLKRINELGDSTLISTAPRHIVFHLHAMITGTDEDRALFLRDIVSDRTKDEFAANDKAEQEIVEILVERRLDVFAMLRTAPSGERSPGVNVRTQNGVVRLMTPSIGQRFNTLEMVVEDGQLKFYNIK